MKGTDAACCDRREILYTSRADVSLREIPRRPRYSVRFATHPTPGMIPKVLVAASLRPLMLSILDHGESYGYAIIQRMEGS